MKSKFDNKKRAEGGNRAAEDSTAAADKTAIEERIEEKIDRDLKDSFPASDPPGWTLGVEKRRGVK